MENKINTEIKETLLLTKDTFNILLDKVIQHFKKKNKIGNIYKDSQLYGFGNYDDKKPNLKNDLELIMKGYVNGKYLYNKFREASSGTPLIKLSREYKYVFFNYLGYKNIFEFLNEDFFLLNQKKRQIELLNQKNNSEDYYYVSYYFGEDKQIHKGQVIIYNQWKNIEMKYIYEEETGEKGIYLFFGNITQNGGFVRFDTKSFIGNKKNEGAKLIFFIGNSSPSERSYLMGTYSGLDKYDRAIAGKMILKKIGLKSDMEHEVSTKVFDPIICQELNKKRIIVESNIRKNPLLFSKKSPYAQALCNTSGEYLLKFFIDKSAYNLRIMIQKYHYNIISLIDSIIIEDDQINVINKGQILDLDFSINGLFYIQKVSIYVKLYHLIQKDHDVQGSFNGVDINNNIVAGNVTIKTIK